MSWMVTASYKIDLLVGYTTSFIYFLSHLGMVYILFQISENKTIAGFGQFEFYFIFGLVEVLWFICFGFFYINSNKLIDQIVEGKIDFLLLKPKNNLFLVIFQEINLDDLLAMFFYLFLTLGLVNYMDCWEWLINNLWSIIMVEICSIILLFLLIWIGSFINFYWPRFMVFRLMVIHNSDISQFPRQIYPRWMQVILMWVFPLLLMTSPVFDLFSGGLNGWFWLNVFLEIVALSLIFILMWRDGIRRYCSAG